MRQQSRSQGMLAMFVIGQDATGVYVVEGVDQHKRAVARGLGQGNAHMVVRYVEKPFDLMSEQGPDEMRDPLVVAADVRNQQRNTSLRECPAESPGRSAGQEGR